MTRQKGGEMVVFRGGRFQRGSGQQVGYGLGSFFSALKRIALPFLQKGAKSVGKAALNTGVNIAQDVLTGEDLKTSAKARVKQTARKLTDDAINTITSQTGNGSKRQAKAAKAKKRKPPSKATSPSSTVRAKRAKSVPRYNDIFGN